MKILLGVCGSISSYKTYDLMRLWIKAGHQVRVVLTQGAEQFVRAQTYGYLGAEEVYCALDDFKFKGVRHIELAGWADRLVIAPLSANTLSRLCRGEASDLLSSIFFAFDREKPICIYPAMNTKMLEHPFTKANFLRMEELSNVFIHPPQSGELACGEVGAGKLPDIAAIADTALAFNPAFRGKHLLITTGATIAPLDPVRYLTNASSGATGYWIAKEALSQGMQVTVIAGHGATGELENLIALPAMKLKRVVTAKEMAAVVDQYLPSSDVYISSAAISDFEFDIADGKLKKSSLGKGLSIKTGIDILASVLEKKTHQKIIGFAAETDLSDDVLHEKLNRKPVDLLVGTQVHNGMNGTAELKGFKVDSASYRLVEEGVITPTTEMNKRQLARKIVEFAARG